METTVPTLTLIPVTATLTPTTAPPTSTPADLPAPEDLLNPSPTPTSEVTLASDALSGAALVEHDPVAAVLVDMAQRQVATDLDLPTRRVRLIDVRAASWTDSTMNCPPPNSTPVPQQTSGYRIVLQAGEQTYIMHTDFDRVVLCPAENEQLPEGFPTEEPTAEVTPELTVEVTSES